MDKFENLQTSSENKQHYIPMEVTAETIKDFGINPADVVWTRIGNRKARVIMIPATEEQYKTFMRPLWREDKRQQRQEPAVSLDKLYEETEYDGTGIKVGILEDDLPVSCANLPSTVYIEEYGLSNISRLPTCSFCRLSHRRNNRRCKRSFALFRRLP